MRRSIEGSGLLGLLLLSGIVAGILSAELLLRWRYPMLPSVAPLQAADLELVPFRWNHGAAPGSSFPSCQDEVLAKREMDRPTSPAGGALRVWVTGDSFAAGNDAPPGEGFANLLARRLGAELGRNPELVNLATPGTGYCSTLSRPLTLLERQPPPDLLVVQLFADDLEERVALVVDDRLVMLPSRVRNPVGRWLVGHSYLANLGWYFARPDAHIGIVRTIDPAARREFRAMTLELVQRFEALGSAVVVTLIGPTGLAFCPADPPIHSRCRWLGPDMDVIAAVLEDAGLAFVDLRYAWTREPDMRSEHERAVDVARGGMAIHPNAEGHQLIADRLLPASLSALASRPVAAGTSQR